MSVHHLLQKLSLSTKIPAAANVALVVIYTALIAAIVGIFEHRFGKHLGEYEAPWTVALVALCTLIICLLVQRLLQRVEDLHLRNRMRVDYFPAGGKERSDLTLKMYQEACRVLESAQGDQVAEIRAVNSFHEIFAAPDAEVAHASYFSVLEKKLGTVPYHRILQCDEPDKLALRLSPPYLRHFEKMVETRDSGTATSKVSLDLAPPMFPTAYVLIHNKNGPSELIWQLNEYIGEPTKDGAVFRPRGLLIISDPEQQLIRHFDDWFTRLANKSSGPVTKEHLGL